MSPRRLLATRNAVLAGATAVALVWLLRYPTSTSSGAQSETTAATSTATVTPGVGGLVAVTGPVVGTDYGPVQVVLRLRDAIVEYVDAPVYPRTGPVDRALNDEAIGQLVAQTILDQTKDVDTISGATQTSEAYRTSLQAALDAANAAPPVDYADTGGHAGHSDS